MLRSIDTFENKVSADKYHVTISRVQVESSSRSRVFLKLTADQALVLIGPWAHVKLTCCKEGWFVRKPVNANPGLKVNRMINFSCMQMSFTAFVLSILRLLKLKTEGQAICNIQ